jgi:hypothetical protein
MGDKALSSVAYTHFLLVAQGVDAELHVWEGLGHAFLYDPELPESREVYAVVVRFFEKHLRVKSRWPFGFRNSMAGGIRSYNLGGSLEEVS